ncbi:hypothetical protein J4421_02980 [Candidatus Woesearchaeota archaeon]|nr:hypothetical protein [Candidatus Woesearchaeota archaeon]
MSVIINVRSLQEGMSRWRIPPGELDGIVAQAARFSGTIARLLLDNESTALYHLDPAIVTPWDDTYIQPLLLGVNYHHGHSEGRHKIVVQNVPERKGPWILFKPPGSTEDTFYLQDLTCPGVIEPRFEEEVANIGKIQQSYLHIGDPLAIFEQFKVEGFKFVDTPMTEAYRKEIDYR